MFKVEEVTDEAAARKAVEDDKVAAAVFIPAEFHRQHSSPARGKSCCGGGVWQLSPSHQC